MAPSIPPPEAIAYLAEGLKVIRNVVTPTLTAYLPDPDIANGTAVIVAPGAAEAASLTPFKRRDNLFSVA